MISYCQGDISKYKQTEKSKTCSSQDTQASRYNGKPNANNTRHTDDIETLQD